ncbi:unnamed protein product [Knipowitschia caucasica]|uniref:Uncharacterized protein n=1 Tax=Knipowitschia caucasica TaxID=637954 RepID=A0AAV2JTX9_KNICA
MREAADQAGEEREVDEAKGVDEEDSQQVLLLAAEAKEVLDVVAEEGEGAEGETQKRKGFKYSEMSEECKQRQSFNK